MFDAQCLLSKTRPEAVDLCIQSVRPAQGGPVFTRFHSFSLISALSRLLIGHIALSVATWGDMQNPNLAFKLGARCGFRLDMDVMSCTKL